MSTSIDFPVKIYNKWYNLQNYTLHKKIFTFTDLKILCNIVTCLILLNIEKKNILKSLDLSQYDLIQHDLIQCGVMTSAIDIIAIYDDLNQITFIKTKILFQKKYIITHSNKKTTEYQIGFFIPT